MKPKSRPKTYMPIGKAAIASKLGKKDKSSEDILKMTPVPQEAHAPSCRPSVEITSCISFQKFRYSGENRPGKKYQDKEFMTLQLNYLADTVVRVIIICTDADNRELIHPNGLVGKDCHDGIYDRTYPVTRACFEIKIPYLRTERIKINAKKDEHKNIVQSNNIQTVLSLRASHLPSPYKERCLSQCTDKYTSVRKFDTTKVCLGVIVTVVSQPGEYNGSLHAISHMVRNASEKTSLSIHKLSQDEISAWNGAEVDIFTNEDGPAIEPDKCIVYVTLPDLSGAEGWRSEHFSPSREYILYKKVIRYMIPPIAPNFDISTPVTGLLHLECPQSNQFCYTEFKYMPLDSSAGFVCIEDIPTPGTKRPFEEEAEIEDIKPVVKHLKTSAESGSPSQVVKENLKTKLMSRQEQVAQQPAENQVRANGDGSQYQALKELPMYSQGQPVYVCHQDPHTGEESYLLDMDSAKATQQQGTHQVIGTTAGGDVSSFQAHPGGVKVVSAHYSDAVPPNTTVLIYTNDGLTEPMAIAQPSGEPMMIEDAGLTQQQPQTMQLVYKDKPQNNTNMNIQHQPPVVQVVRRDPVATKHSSSNTQICQQAVSTVNNPSLVRTQISYAMATIKSQKPVQQSFDSQRYTTPGESKSSPTSLHRMVIPHKPMQESSPWDVEGTEDTEAYNICMGHMNYDSQRAMNYDSQREMNYGSQRAASPHVAVKKEVPDSSYSNERESRVCKVEVTKPKLAKLNESANSQVVASSSDKPGNLPSMPALQNESYLVGAMENNLPTFEVSEIADKLVNGLDSVDAESETAS